VWHEPPGRSQGEYRGAQRGGFTMSGDKVCRWQTLVDQPSALGESPFWHPLEQQLYWVDIPGKKILRCNVYMGTVDSWPMDAPALEPGCIAPARQGGLVIALRDGIYRAREWRGALTRIASFDYDPATQRFNDGKCDSLGRLWAGTMCDQRGERNAKLYCIDGRAGGAPQVRVMAGGAGTANGLAWSPDNRTLYWADTPSHAIRAWDWDAQANLLSNERVFKQFPPKPEGWVPDYKEGGQAGYSGRPDGAAVDVQGNYYVAMYEGRRVLKLSPAGELLEDIPTPAQCPTMPCFGGEDLQTLYLTSARKGRPDAELAELPLSGCVFALRVAVPGLPVNFYEGD
jgi:sugar lactone lactonase YvrE